MIPPPTIVSRPEWKATTPSSALRPLTNPPTKVVLTNTGTNTCTTHEECEAAVRRIQRDHVTRKGLPDIQYNFLVGGDGRIYEGRGWHHQSGSSYPNHQTDSIIDVAIIDSFRSDEDEEHMAEMIMEIPFLILHGVNQGYLDKKYDVAYEFDLEEPSFWSIRTALWIIGLLILLKTLYNLIRRKRNKT